MSTRNAQRRLGRLLKRHGLTVTSTRDYDALLINTARLVRFERIIRATASKHPHLQAIVDGIDQGATKPTPTA